MSQPFEPSIIFGGFNDEKYSSFDAARVLILPLAGDKKSANVNAIVNASCRLELYDEETDAEVYKIGIHTLDTFEPNKNFAAATQILYKKICELINFEKFICLIGNENTDSAQVVRAYAEKFHDLSVLQIAARPNLHNFDETTEFSRASVMFKIIKDWRIPTVQVGIRSISAEEARLIGDGIPIKIYLAKDIVGQTDWIGEALENLTENVYLTIDVSGFDPSVMPSVEMPEPGGLGWYDVLNLIRKLAEKRRVIGMDLIEYHSAQNHSSAAFFGAKLIYKSTGYIFRDETPKVAGI